MELPTRPDINDENSVFRKLFSDEEPSQSPSKSSALETIFKDAPAQTEPLSVQDFLPQF